MHYLRGSISGGWHIPGGLTLVLTWLMANRGEASNRGRGLKQRSRHSWNTVCSNTTSRLFQRKKMFVNSTQKGLSTGKLFPVWHLLKLRHSFGKLNTVVQPFCRFEPARQLSGYCPCPVLMMTTKTPRWPCGASAHWHLHHVQSSGYCPPPQKKSHSRHDTDTHKWRLSREIVGNAHQAPRIIVFGDTECSTSPKDMAHFRFAEASVEQKSITQIRWSIFTLMD